MMKVIVRKADQHIMLSFILGCAYFCLLLGTLFVCWLIATAVNSDAGLILGVVSFVVLGISPVIIAIKAYDFGLSNGFKL